MKRLWKLLMLLPLLIDSCEVESSDADYDIVGAWYGIHSYYNPVGGTKFQYLTIEFRDDYTGNLSYESPVSYSAAFFRYSISNGIITCKGSSANTYGDITEDFSLTLRIDDDRLLPQNKYTNFILTRDGSVETDGYGEEIIDKSELLERIWIASAGDAILDLRNDGIFEEYILESPHSKKYVSVNTGKYTYDPRYERITFNTVVYDIIVLNENNMTVRNDNKTITYYVGSQNDLPSQVDMNGMLLENRLWASDNSKYYFTFWMEGESYKVSYTENSTIVVGSYGQAYLSARGTYKLSGDKLQCNYTNVYWPGGELSKYADIFPGWSYATQCIKTYTISYNKDNSITVIDESGCKMYLKPR